MNKPIVMVAPLLFVAVAAAARGDGIPLRGWTVPMYSLDGLGKTVDATPPRAFIGLPPCRVIDTRGGAPLGAGGILGNSEARDFNVWNICGIPAGTDAISANFTVTGSPPATPAGAFILAYPTGSPPSPIVSLLNFSAGQTIANAAIVPLDFFGSLTINTSHSTHVIMDVNGYFSENLGSPQSSFTLINNSTLATMLLHNASTTCVGNCGLLVSIASNESARAIRGNYNGPGEGQGVWGATQGTGFDAAGVLGTTSSTSGAAGVKGLVGSDVLGSTAVRGEHYGTGLIGVGVAGSHGGGGWGVLGTTQTGFGVYGAANNPGAGGVGVRFAGGLSGTGTKSFIEPHPTNPALAIKYVSLEGPEAGTYFRGKGKFVRGIARIAVPEDFRMVTAEEGLSVQITPIGEMATVAVSRIGLDEIVVKGSRNVEFFFTVNGVRRAYPDWNPLVPSTELRPTSPDERIPGYYSKEERGRLIANGTYTEDGRVNMETAKKLGWDKAWGKGNGERTPSAPDRPK